MNNQKVLKNLPGLFAAFSLFTLMSMTFADVILRSVFNAPIEVSADLTRLLMAIMVFSVMPVISARNAHISVDLLEGLFEKYHLVRLRNGFVHLFCGVILIWPASRVFDLAERSRSYGDKMEYLGFSVHYLGWFIAVMTAITAGVSSFKGLAILFRLKLFGADNG